MPEKADYERDVEFLLWLAERLPAYDIANAQRLRECARHLKELAEAPQP